MIPFASQRANGQDLATHLQNAQDNEQVELAHVRGAIAKDLHGAFAEWEVQAHSLTRCQKYLYSLSVNPDPRQGPLTRAQYFDYIGRAEERLGLAGQPRAVVFHVKEGREHCHVVWSRIDAEKGKAVQLSFDKEKLMAVTREFARDHGLTLPKGYERDRDREAETERGPRQASLYEQHQQNMSGLTQEQRMAAVTDAWRSADSPQAFVAALSQQGYILATGKRPYVLVDLDGNMNALPKLIADKQIRTKDIRAFLGAAYPPESLPSVEEARKLAAEKKAALGKARDADERPAVPEPEDREEQIAEMKRRQAFRRKEAEDKRAALQARQQIEKRDLDRRHFGERKSLKAAYLIRTRDIRAQRQERAPRGLAAFLGRVTGVEAIRERVHRYQDVKRYQAYEARAEEVAERQRRETANLTRRHEMQALDMARSIRNLDKLDARERRSLQAGLERQRREAARQHGHGARMPSLKFELKPPGRPAMVVKAMHRHRHGPARPVTDLDEKHALKEREDLTREFDAAAQGLTRPVDPRGAHPDARPQPAVDITEDFERAVEGLPPRRRRGEDRGPPDIARAFKAAAEGRDHETGGEDARAPTAEQDRDRERDRERTRNPRNPDRPHRPRGREPGRDR